MIFRIGRRTKKRRKNTASNLPVMISFDWNRQICPLNIVFMVAWESSDVEGGQAKFLNFLKEP